MIARLTVAGGRVRTIIGGHSVRAVAEGRTSRMRELIQIESSSEHACSKPSVERRQVLEPLSGRWSWMTVFNCCSKLTLEIISEPDQAAKIKRAA
jgi:hypothetical protein